MYVKELELKNFRNYNNARVELGKVLNVLIGSNAQGKTNILESLYFLSTGKSYRTQKDKELIKWDKEKAYAGAEIVQSAGNYKIESLISRNEGIQYKINGAKFEAH